MRSWLKLPTMRRRGWKAVHWALPISERQEEKKEEKNQKSNNLQAPQRKRFCLLLSGKDYFFQMNLQFFFGGGEFCCFWFLFTEPEEWCIINHNPEIWFNFFFPKLLCWDLRSEITGLKGMNIFGLLIPNASLLFNNIIYFNGMSYIYACFSAAWLALVFIFLFFPWFLISPINKVKIKPEINAHELMALITSPASIGSIKVIVYHRRWLLSV